ncbi:MAG TPA: T9SS type A sorting domain-containing protein [Ignavibacteria bacterium]|nr:T9SS type A sorting domain-containing protein [Ignavibacteria bacterium]
MNQNYPNPFNPSTNIEYAIPNTGGDFVTIKIYNLLGKEVMSLVNDFKKAGRYIISFNGSDLSSGVYYYKLAVSSPNPISAGNFQQIWKMVLLK